MECTNTITDHPMLTAMVAVDALAAGISGKANAWEIDTEQEYRQN